MQQHFNDLSLRVRNFAVTVTTAVLGGALLAFREAPAAAPWILGAGAVAWLAFYMMDAGWYHQLLLGAVAHGENVEKALKEKGIDGFGLAGEIRRKSGVKVKEKSRLRLLEREWRSKERLHGFYLGGLVLFGLLGISAWLTVEGRSATSSAKELAPTALSSVPALLFPPEGAELQQLPGAAFGWELVRNARSYRLEVDGGADGTVLDVVLPRARGSFIVPADLVASGGKQLRWRSVPLDEIGRPIHSVDWRSFSVRE